MAKRPVPWDDQVDLVSSDDEAADMEADDGASDQKPNIDGLSYQPANEKHSEGAMVRRAKIYQEYMKKVPIPCQRGSVIPCNSWMGLAKSIKELYGQPLHYLTNTLLKQWDQARFETGDEYQPLDTVIHPLKAEATIWFVEEVHRCTASYHQLSKLWLGDPMHHAYVDAIFPKI
ncbi:protein RDM1-like [Chenopodium quinoa]|uniref:Protein RDM1 n=1 Tax=Chenopodium quinoa TaxID=63459 RepID=A0A803KPY4_CHEQI|nr:protein RDM1-like [Chenopodium quinoa]